MLYWWEESQISFYAYKCSHPIIAITLEHSNMQTRANKYLLKMRTVQLKRCRSAHSRKIGKGGGGNVLEPIFVVFVFDHKMMMPFRF